MTTLNLSSICRAPCANPTAILWWGDSGPYRSAAGSRCEWAPDDHFACADPSCTGPEESCEVFTIPKSELTEECNGGSLYLNLVTNKWGEPRDDLGYATSVIELVHEIDAQYRTRSSQQGR